MKKKVAWGLACCLLLGLIGCQKEQGSSEQSQIGSVGSASEESSNFNPTGYPVVNEAITLTICGSLGSSPTYVGMNLFEHLTKVTGVEFTFEEYSDDVFREKKALFFGSDDLPDIFIGGEFTDAELMEYGSGGQLLALNDLITQYGPNIQDAFSQIPDAKAMSTSADGNIYALPLINQVPRDLHLRYWISTTWLENVGKEVPTTLDEYAEVLRAFQKEDANGNGDPNDEIPLTGTGGVAVDGLILNALGLNANSAEYQLTADENGTVFCLNASDAYREYLRYLRMLYEEKLLDNDFFVQTSEQMTAKGEAGILGSFHSAASYMTCGSEIGYEYTQFDALTSSLSNKKLVTAGTGITPGVTAITTACQYPEVALRLLDYCYTEEGSIVCRNGEEGVGWEWVDDEKTLWENFVPEGYDNSQAWRVVVTAAGKLCTWLRVDYQNKQNSSNALWLNEMTMEYSEPYFVSQFPSLSLSEEDLNTVTPIITDVTTFVKEARARFITGEDDLDGKWDSYIRDLKSMGIDTVVEIYQPYYDEYRSNLQ